MRKLSAQTSKSEECDQLCVKYCLESLPGPQLFSTISSYQSEIKLYKTYLPSWYIELMWLEKNQYNEWRMFLALLPIKSLFQIARRRRISRLFTTNKFNVDNNLLISATTILKNLDETYLIASILPNKHLAKGNVRASSKYSWPIPLRHCHQWRYQHWNQRKVLLISMPRLYWQLVKLLSLFWFMSDNFLVLYDSILRNWLSVSFNKVGESYLHYGYPVNHQDGKIDDMEFRPLPPGFSCQWK